MMDKENRNRESRLDVTREERLRAAASARRRRRRNANIRAFAVMVVFAAMVCGGVMLFTHLRQQGEIPASADASVEGTGEAPREQEVSGGDSGASVPAVSDAVLYSQEELDAKIAEAVASAQTAQADQILQEIKLSLSDGMTTIETLRPYYPEEIIVASGGKYFFVPINRSLAQSQLEQANLNILESGEYQYMTDGQVTSHKGIDVSSHQGDIDWNLVAQDGVEFAFIRVAYRGYGTGKLVEDEKFEANIQGAIAAGIKVGVYVFSQAITEEELLEEADLVLQKIAPYHLDCPVVFDVERVSGNGRMNDISMEERTNLTLLFCQTIENAGYKPMIYYNTEMSILMVDVAALEAYDKWYASYSEQMFYPYAYKVWQYSPSGTVQGIGTEVDLNISFTAFWE